MQIESLTIRGFRCFDDDGQTIVLDDLTCFVGPNASGKTAAMIALARLFGESNAQRQVVPTDFHLVPGEELKAKSPRSILIECRLVFPELESGAVVGADAIPEAFNQMIVDVPEGTPYCRVRLDATWTDDGTPTGDVQQSLSWILTDSDDLKIINDGHRRSMHPSARAKVRVIYLPAARDPDQQIRATTATSFGRLLDALAWEGADEALKAKLAEVQDQVAELTGIKTMNTQVQASWQRFYDGLVAQEVAFRALENEPSALLRLLVPTFQPSEEASGTMYARDLSDGLRSLFSLSLSLGLFRVEKMLREKAAKAGFKAEVAEKLPVLTVFAVEEPENHLSPQYLGRVVREMEDIAADDQAQVLLSSHSPSILRRIEPDNVRYFLGHEHSRQTHVKRIPLPDDNTDEAFKYVREAVRGFPELYFARLVVLGEGPSEEIVLRRLFEASGTPLDSHFISVVPLGGRHINHFWRLLHGLEIPFLTMLDLDREKEGAGWGRVQYVRDQLVHRFGTGHEALTSRRGKGKTLNLEEDRFDKLHRRSNTAVKKMNVWIKHLENTYDVFFSAPLDLDFAMLEAFPDAYKALAPAPMGPRLPKKGTVRYNEVVNERMKLVLAADATAALPDFGTSYTPEQQELFAWYKYFFVDGSKPVTHMRALLTIPDDDLTGSAPDTLKSLVRRAQELVAQRRDGT